MFGAQAECVGPVGADGMTIDRRAAPLSAQSPIAETIRRRCVGAWAALLATTPVMTDQQEEAMRQSPGNQGSPETSAGPSQVFRLSARGGRRISSAWGHTRNKRRAAPSVSASHGGRTTYFVGLGAP